jgi:RNA 3'-terminal phosphate cyclase (ATP)
MIRIDGSFGEGGGQILRFAAALAAASGKRVEITNIRSKRPNPGIRPQHYTALKIMRDLFGGYIEGLQVGSTRVVISLKGPKAGNIRYNVGTAGSISLIMQSIVPAMLLADGESNIELIGGTDVKWSPTIDYMRYVYSSMVSIIGGELDVLIVRRGYYPAGGGIVRLRLSPRGRLSPINMVDRGEIDRVVIRSVVSRLPRHILDRQVNSVINGLEKSGLADIRDLLVIEKELLGVDKAAGPGTSVLVVARHSNKMYCGGDSVGERGKPAERVGEEAFKSFYEWYASNAYLDVFAGDMVIPYAAIVEGNSSFTVPKFTLHMESALYVAERIMNIGYKVKRLDGMFRIDIVSGGA